MGISVQRRELPRSSPHHRDLSMNKRMMIKQWCYLDLVLIPQNPNTAAEPPSFGPTPMRLPYLLTNLISINTTNSWLKNHDNHRLIHPLNLLQLTHEIAALGSATIPAHN